MIGPLLLAPLAALAVAAVARRRVSRHTEHEYAEQHPKGANGIATGAEGFTLEGINGRALLLLHGSGDTPQSLRYLGERLRADGYTVHAPLLPGHGRSPRAFARASAADYEREAQHALEQLDPSSNWVGVIGQSMGGALAATLASASHSVRALVLLAPYLEPPRNVQWARRTSWLWRWSSPYLRGQGQASVHDRHAASASLAYGTFSAGALDALCATAEVGRRALAKIAVPTLVINSEQDNRIPRSVAEAAIAAIRAPVEVHWVTGCGHVIAVDYCKDTVADLVLSFLARHAG